MIKKDQPTENYQTETQQANDFFDFNLIAGTSDTNVDEVLDIS